MRSKLTNMLQGIILFDGIIYIVMGILFYITPLTVLGFVEKIPPDWLNQVRNDGIVGPLYFISRGFAALLFTSGAAMILPLFDPLRYRGLVYYNGALFPLFASILLIKNGLLLRIKETTLETSAATEVTKVAKGGAEALTKVANGATEAAAELTKVANGAAKAAAELTKVTDGAEAAAAKAAAGLTKVANGAAETAAEAAARLTMVANKTAEVPVQHGQMIVVIIGLIFATIFILTITGLLVTRKEAKEGKE
ncbi:MAG: hypothetical protein GY754_07025 [bacterium]|nr:hypothetical protein [bacterium]